MNSNMEKERRALFHHLQREIHDDRVLQAMEDVPRELFVPPEIREHAYKDVALQIAEGQTISQPFIVAASSSALELGGGENVLELGTGSGYQAAVLSLLVPDGSLLTIDKDPEPGRVGGGSAAGPRVSQCRGQGSRRRPGMPGRGALRRHHSHRRDTKPAPLAPGANGPRRPHGASNRYSPGAGARSSGQDR